MPIRSRGGAFGTIGGAQQVSEALNDVSDFLERLKAERDAKANAVDAGFLDPNLRGKLIDPKTALEYLSRGVGAAAPEKQDIGDVASYADMAKIPLSPDQHAFFAQKPATKENLQYMYEMFGLDPTKLAVARTMEEARKAAAANKGTPKNGFDELYRTAERELLNMNRAYNIAEKNNLWDPNLKNIGSQAAWQLNPKGNVAEAAAATAARSQMAPGASEVNQVQENSSLALAQALASQSRSSQWMQQELQKHKALVGGGVDSAEESRRGVVDTLSAALQAKIQEMAPNDPTAAAAAAQRAGALLGDFENRAGVFSGTGEYSGLPVTNGAAGAPPAARAAAVLPTSGPAGPAIKPDAGAYLDKVGVSPGAQQ